jgi:hypothetical protein
MQTHEIVGQPWQIRAASESVLEMIIFPLGTGATKLSSCTDKFVVETSENSTQEGEWFLDNSRNTLAEAIEYIQNLSKSRISPKYARIRPNYQKGDRVHLIEAGVKTPQEYWFEVLSTEVRKSNRLSLYDVKASALFIPSIDKESNFIDTLHYRWNVSYPGFNVETTHEVLLLRVKSIKGEKMSLKDYSEAELKAELEIREKQLNAPKVSDNTNDEIVSQIFSTVKRCLDTSIEQKHWDEDNKQLIFEAVMTAFYGPEYFTFHYKFFR